MGNASCSLARVPREFDAWCSVWRALDKDARGRACVEVMRLLTMLWQASRSAPPLAQGFYDVHFESPEALAMFVKGQRMPPFMPYHEFRTSPLAHAPAYDPASAFLVMISVGADASPPAWWLELARDEVGMFGAEGIAELLTPRAYGLARSAAA